MVGDQRKVSFGSCRFFCLVLLLILGATVTEAQQPEQLPLPPPVGAPSPMRARRLVPIVPAAKVAVEVAAEGYHLYEKHKKDKAAKEGAASQPAGGSVGDGNDDSRPPPHHRQHQHGRYGGGGDDSRPPPHHRQHDRYGGGDDSRPPPRHRQHQYNPRE